MTPRRRSEIGKPFGSQLTLKVRDFWANFLLGNGLRPESTFAASTAVRGGGLSYAGITEGWASGKCEPQLLWKSDHQCVNRQVHQLSGFSL